MESNKIEILIEKYLEGNTSIPEENELRDYFSSPNVAPNLEHYKPVFGYFSIAKEEKFDKEVILNSKNHNWRWLTVAASVVVLLGVGMFSYLNFKDVPQNQNLGTFDDPEVAFKETQKALSKLSIQINTGFESMHHIEEYENSKNLIFNQ